MINPTKRTKITQKITIIGALVNFLLAIFKVIAGLIGNSGALIADGIHSLSDLLSDGIVLYAAKHSAAAPDAEHPYGHERFETIATLGLAIILAIIGVGIIFDAISRLSAPTPLTNNALLLAVAGASVVSKEILYWLTLKIGERYKSPMLVANAWHHRSDALSSIVVLVGIIGALNGYIYLDGVAAIVVGLMILSISWKLGFGAAKELVDTSIDNHDLENLHAAILKISGVESVHSLRTRKNGHKISADVHVEVEPFLSVSEGHIISVSVERAAKNCLDELSDVTVHIDPEDDEFSSLYDNLPERAEALKILNQALADDKCDGKIQHLQLHYLNGKIHIDFYLPLTCLKADQDFDKILTKLQKTVSKLPAFGNIRLYFGKN